MPGQQVGSEGHMGYLNPAGQFCHGTLRGSGAESNAMPVPKTAITYMQYDDSLAAQHSK